MMSAIKKKQINKQNKKNGIVLWSKFKEREMILAWRIGNDENLEKISRKKLYLSYSLKEKKKE